MRRSVSTPDETLRRELKIRHTAGLSIFDKLRGASSGDENNTVLNARYYLSNKVILPREIKDAIMSSYSPLYQKH